MRTKIYLSGDVLPDDYTGETGVITPAGVRAAVEAVGKDNAEIHINSNGGSVSAGLAIANYIASCGNVVGYVDGWAASAASLIALSCKTLYMPVNTFLMIHNPQASAEGDMRDLQKAAADLQKITDSLINFYTMHAKIGRNEIVEMLDKETWLDAPEAADTFLNIIVCEGMDLQAVALADGLNYPKSLKNAMLTAKINRAIIESV